MYYSIKMYLYEKNARITIENKIYEYIMINHMKDICFQRSIQGGHHLCLIFTDEISRAQMQEYIESLIDDYIPIRYDIGKIKNQIKLISQMEEVGPDLNLRKDGTIELENLKKIHCRKLNSIYHVSAFEKIEVFKGKLMLDFISLGYFTMSEENQNILLLNLFLNASNLHHAGIKFGYLSMKSNILYFLSQLDSRKNSMKIDKYNQITYYLSHVTSIEKGFIENGIRDFFKNNSNSVFQKKTKELVDLLVNCYDNSLLVQENLKQSSDFYENSKSISNLNDFHKAFFSNQKFIEQYKSKNFIIYRYVIDVFYQMMPMLRVSPIRKQKITKLLSDAAEAYYHTNWKEIYNVMEERIG